MDGLGVLGFDLDFFGAPSPLMDGLDFLGGEPDGDCVSRSMGTDSLLTRASSSLGVVGILGLFAAATGLALGCAPAPSFGNLFLASCASLSACKIIVSSEGGPGQVISRCFLDDSSSQWAEWHIPFVHDLNLRVPPPTPTIVLSEFFHDLTFSRRGNGPVSPPLFGVK